MIDLARWHGRPYAGEGYCKVLVAEILAAHGIPWPEDARRPEDATDWARVDRARELDVVVFTRAGVPSHVGLCLGGDRFFHVEEGGTARTERLSSPLWFPRIEGLYRYTGNR